MAARDAQDGTWAEESERGTSCDYGSGVSLMARALRGREADGDWSGRLTVEEVGR